MSDDVQVEVVIIGSGIAGLSAANAAWEAGARQILVVESEGVVGGSSRLSGGIVMGAGTRIQRANGIEDSAEAMFHEYMAWNAWRLDAAVARRFCDEAGHTVDWLADLGVPFSGNVVLGGDEPQPRTYDVTGGGQAIVDALHARCREREIDVALGKRVDRLLEHDGAVVGVGAGDEEVHADAVIVATGGFGANRALLERHYPSAVHGDATWYIGADGARGDALALAEQVGAQLTGHDRGLRLLHPDFFRTLEAYQPAWVVVVNGTGRRFYDESAPYGIVDDVHRWQGDDAWVLFDDAQLRWSGGTRAQYKDPVMAARLRTPNWTADNVDIQVAAGRMCKADTVAGLAEQMGVPVATLEATVARYNEWCALGEDREFAKAAKFLQPVAVPPFYAARVVPATICLTSCGLRIDPDARVLADDGRVIPGLFAAGECTGGVLGDRYMGSGNSIGNCATMGRVAGTAAARTWHAGPRT
jgi:fumarate reductase flavoprotein subunit